MSWGGNVVFTYGAVGPVARASGVDSDLWRDNPYLAYGSLEFAVPTQTGGDVLARVVVRALEMLESSRIVEQALDQMPAGMLHVGNIYSVPAGEAVARTEAPRGEVFYYVESNGSDTPAHVKVRTPSFANIPTVAAMVKGSDLADVPLIQAAVDPCYSCKNGITVKAVWHIVKESAKSIGVGAVPVTLLPIVCCASRA